MKKIILIILAVGVIIAVYKLWPCASCGPIVYKDMLKVWSPRAEEMIKSPLKVSGEARGNWYFEATFPITLVNWDGLIIAEGYASAVLDPNDPESTWMATEYVPFEGTIEFKNP